jgi:hypothetical protein
MTRKNMLLTSLALTAFALAVGLTLFNSLGQANQVYAKTATAKAVETAAPSAQIGSGVGSSNPLGNVKVTRVLLQEGVIATPRASDLTDNVEIGWELTPVGSCAVAPAGFDVSVTLNRLGNAVVPPQTKTLRVSGGARSANLVFGTRVARKVKSIDVTITAVADLKAVGKTSKNF